MKTLDGCKSKKEAMEREPEAVIYRKTSHGYLAFMSQQEYEIWKNQK